MFFMTTQTCLKCMVVDTHAQTVCHGTTDSHRTENKDWKYAYVDTESNLLYSCNNNFHIPEAFFKQLNCYTKGNHNQHTILVVTIHAYNVICTKEHGKQIYLETILINIMSVPCSELQQFPK